MTNARVREALTAGANVKDKGPHVADGVLTVTPDAPEVAEWRSKCPLDCGGPSSTYLDDDDDEGPKPNELYGKFTWKIENFSEISKRELRSNVFDVGNYKWYILVYPQGCDVCNHLSLFLCVADYDKLLPGWSHFAQFTIAVVNKDPKKSKYSDTLHRFCKKEHDWGWKKFMELSKVLDGFTVAGTLVIKAQVQVILDKPSRPFRCLDPQYRRELVRVYLTNVEAICRRVCEEKRMKMAWVRDNLQKFREFWNELSPQQQKGLMTERADVILKGIVKQFFNEKEVTSTLVMDALLSGCKQIEEHSRLSEEGKPTEGSPGVIINADKHIFTFGWGILDLLESCSKDFLPASKDDKQLVQGADGLGLRSGQEGDDYRRDSIERDEKRLAELGRRSVEMYVIAHLFSEQLEIAFREAEALKKQDQLIAEEEEAERREESRLQAKAMADREKRAKKKERKKMKKEAEKVRKEAEELVRRQTEEELKLSSAAANARPQQDDVSASPAPAPTDPVPQPKPNKRARKRQQQQQQQSSQQSSQQPSQQPPPPTSTSAVTAPSPNPKDTNGPSHRTSASSASTPDKTRLPNGKAHTSFTLFDPAPSSSTQQYATELFGGEPAVPPPSNSGSRTFDRAVASRPVSLTSAAVGTLPSTKSDTPATGRKAASSTCSSSSSGSSQLSDGPVIAKAHFRSVSDRAAAEAAGDVCTTSHRAGADGRSSRGSSLERGSEEIIKALQDRVLFLERELVGRDVQIAALKLQVAEFKKEPLMQQASSSSAAPQHAQQGSGSSTAAQHAQQGGGSNTAPQHAQQGSGSNTASQHAQQQQQQPPPPPPPPSHSDDRDRWVQAARPASRGGSLYTSDFAHQDNMRANGPDTPSTNHSHSLSLSTPSSTNPSNSAAPNGPSHFIPSASSAPLQSWAATPDNYSREFPPLQAAVSADPPQPPPRHASAAAASAASSSTTTAAGSSSPAGSASGEKEVDKPDVINITSSSSGPAVGSPNSTAQKETAGSNDTAVLGTSSSPTALATEPPAVNTTALTPPIGTSTLLTPPNLPPSAHVSSAPVVAASHGSANIPPLPTVAPLAPLRRAQHPYGDTPTNGSAASSPQPQSSSPAAPSPAATTVTHTSASLRIPALSHPNRATPSIPIPSQSASPSDQLSALSSSHSQHNQPPSPVTPQLLPTPSSPHAGPTDHPPVLLRTQSMPSHLESRKDFNPVVLLDHSNGRPTPTNSLPATGSSLMTPAAAITRVRPPLDHPTLTNSSTASTPTAKSAVPYIPTSTTNVLSNGVSSLSLHSVGSGDFSKPESSTPSYRNAAATGILPACSTAASLPQLQVPLPPTSAPAGLTPSSVIAPASTGMVSNMVPSSSKGEDGVVSGNGGGSATHSGPPRGFGPAPSRFGLNSQSQPGLGFDIHSKVSGMNQRPRHLSPSENPGLDDFAHINLITDLLTD